MNVLASYPFKNGLVDHEFLLRRMSNLLEQALSDLHEQGYIEDQRIGYRLTAKGREVSKMAIA